MSLNLLDLTSNNNDFTTNSGVVEANDAPSGLAGATKSAEFDSGGADYLELADTSSLSVTGNWTFEMWLYTGNGNGDVGLTKDSGNPNISYDAYLDGGENMTLVVSDDGAVNSFKFQASGISFNTWTHLAWVYTASTGKAQFFLNGAQVGSDQTGLDTSVFNGTAPIKLLSTRNTTTRISDARFWNTARTVTEINNNKGNRLVGNESGLVAYWPLEHLPPIYTRGSENSLPADDTDLENYYTEGEYTDVATSNDVRVEQDAVAEFMIHEFKDDVGGENSANLTCELQTSVAPTASTVYLQIYNRDTTTWDTVDSDNSSAADTDFTLNASVADLTDYKDANDIISCRVYQEAI